MLPMPPPSTQKAGFRPISFLLDDQSLGVSPPRAFVDLLIRPEELTRTDLSRATVNQTFGGAWVDNFGPGIPQITISGHTGWRRDEVTGEDGEGRFAQLKEQVFDEWHASRARNIRTGLDPDLVRLIFTDALDSFSVAVVPMQFVLRRNKRQPLLMQYQIQMLVVDDAAFPTFTDEGFIDPEAMEAAGLDSLEFSTDLMVESIPSLDGLLDASLAGPMGAFMAQSGALFGSIRGVLAAGTEAVGAVLNVATMAAQVGANVFQTVASIAAIPQMIKAELMSIAAMFTNILCVLRNALNRRLFVADYADLYGASNCSSTFGGSPISPLAGTNAFELVVPAPGNLPYALSQPAQQAMASIAVGDVVLNPMSVPDLSANMRVVSGGFFAL